MKVLFILESGIPEYRKFLFEKLAKEKKITEFLILHNGKTFNGYGDFNQKKIKFIGNNKIGLHIGILKYIYDFDVVISSYNLRIISCWYPMFFKNKWILWGKGMGNNDSFIVKKLRKITSKRASRILVYNAFKKKELVFATGVENNKVIPYNNTVSILNSGYCRGVGREYFLYFGRIQERKGLKELILQYKEYLETCSGKNVLKLRFVGNGTFLKDLRALTKKLKIERLVEFYPGVYDNKSIKFHFEKAIAYVSPYNVGLAVVNSFAYGVPVVTCKEKQVGPEFHYLDDKNSFILENYKELYLCFKRLSENNTMEDTFQYCYNFYKNNLTSDYMYNHFLKTIMETYKEEKNE